MVDHSEYGKEGLDSVPGAGIGGVVRYQPIEQAQIFV
jgi:hypothetical protein